MKDFLNQEIEIGDIVVYASRQASNMHLTKAQVRGISFSKTFYGTSEERLLVERLEAGGWAGHALKEGPSKWYTPKKMVYIRTPEYIVKL